MTHMRGMVVRERELPLTFRRRGQEFVIMSVWHDYITRLLDFPSQMFLVSMVTVPIVIVDAEKWVDWLGNV